MIKFFRNIRKQLLVDNRVSKYLVYAFGEIILVVVGILIALSVNNWNGNRKDKFEEFKILAALKEELTESRNRIDKTMQLQKLVVERNVKLCELLVGNEGVESVDSIPQIFNWGALVYFRAEPVSGTYDALIGAGKTVLIQNEKLSELLAEYYAEIKLGYEDHEYGMIINGIILEKTADYNGPLLSLLSKGTNNEMLDEAVKSLMNDKSIVGIISKKQGVERRRYRWQKRLLKQISEILEIIDDELMIVEH